MHVQDALSFVRHTLLKQLAIEAIDDVHRTKSQYFKTRNRRVFGLILGDIKGGKFSRQQTDVLLEQCVLPPGLHAGLELIVDHYRGSATFRPTLGIDLKSAQTRVRVSSTSALGALLAWYSGRQTVEPQDLITLPGAVSAAQGSVAEATFPHVTTKAVAPKVESPAMASPIRLPPVHAPTVVPETGLLILQPFIDQILAGKKIWEMRSRATNQRGWIALIQAGSGLVVGIARLVDCIGPLSELQMQADVDKHGIAPERLPEVPTYRYAWVLADVLALPQPVPYEHRNGAVIFARLDPLARNALCKQLDNRPA